MTNEGLVNAGGRSGVLIATSFELSEIEAAMVGSNEQNVRIEVVIDPATGDTLEMRIVPGESESPGLSFISRVLELRGRDRIPDAQSRVVRSPRDGGGRTLPSSGRPGS